jgi:hypothetical protein
MATTVHVISDNKEGGSVGHDARGGEVAIHRLPVERTTGRRSCTSALARAAFNSLSCTFIIVKLFGGRESIFCILL